MAGWVLDEFGSLTPASQSRTPPVCLPPCPIAFGCASFVCASFVLHHSLLDDFDGLSSDSSPRWFAGSGSGEVKLDSTAETKSDKELQKRAESRKDDRNADAIRR
jgi:hypothetical protein